MSELGNDRVDALGRAFDWRENLPGCFTLHKADGDEVGWVVKRDDGHDLWRFVYTLNGNVEDEIMRDGYPSKDTAMRALEQFATGAD